MLGEENTFSPQEPQVNSTIGIDDLTACSVVKVFGKQNVSDRAVSWHMCATYCVQSSFCVISPVNAQQQLHNDLCLWVAIFKRLDTIQDSRHVGLLVDAMFRTVLQHRTQAMNVMLLLLMYCDTICYPLKH